MCVSITDPGMTLVHGRSDYLRSGRYTRGLFKPATKWISILLPLDFVNLSSIIPDVCFRLRRGASSTTNMESVSVHQTVRVHIKEHATAT